MVDRLARSVIPHTGEQRRVGPLMGGSDKVALAQRAVAADELPLSNWEAVSVCPHNGVMTDRKALPAIDATRCTGCGWCVAVCPPHVLSLETQNWKKFSTLHDEPGCTGCALCAVKCPFDAIVMERRPIPDRPKRR